MGYFEAAIGTIENEDGAAEQGPVPTPVKPQLTAEERKELEQQKK